MLEPNSVRPFCYRSRYFPAPRDRVLRLPSSIAVRVTAQGETLARIGPHNHFEVVIERDVELEHVDPRLTQSSQACGLQCFSVDRGGCYFAPAATVRVPSQRA